MSLIKYHQNCRLCGLDKLETIYNFGEHYLHGSFVYKDYQPPRRKVLVELVRCPENRGGCGLIQSRHSIDPSVLYARYGYRSSTNETMKNHLINISQNAKQTGYIGRMLDIGGNDGFFISQFQESIDKVIVDPCDIVNSVKLSNTKIFNTTFPCKEIANERDFDFISAIACFYDLDNPVDFLDNIQQKLLPNGFGVVEIAYWVDKMAKTAFDDFCQEHVCFYSFDTLEKVFQKAGLKIFDYELNDINGGSLQVWFCHSNCNNFDTLQRQLKIQQIKLNEFEMRIDSDETYVDFAARVNSLKAKSAHIISEIRLKNKTIHLLGASTKGNVLLETLGLTGKDIPYASERSPEKWGGETLSGIKMISEEDSRKMNPDYYFCCIWAFKKEVLQREKEYIMNGGKIIFPIPNFEIVDKDNYNNYI